MAYLNKNTSVNLYVLLFSGLVWCAFLTLLIISLTNILDPNPLKEYRILIGIGFLAVSGLLRRFYRVSR